MAKRTVSESDKVKEKLVLLAVRLPESVMDRLTLAAAQRKVQKRPPFTNQAIVMDALEAWLAKHADGGEKRGK